MDTINAENEASSETDKTLAEYIKESILIGNECTYNENARDMHKIVFESNDFYIEMLTKLKDMRKLCHSKSTKIIERPAQLDDWVTQVLENGDTELNVDDAIWQDDPEVQKQLKKITDMDTQIIERISDWNILKSERRQIQSQIYDDMKSTEDVHTIQEQRFIELCDLEVGPRSRTCSIKSDETDKELSEKINTKKGSEKTNEADGRNFIQENRERVKNMSTNITESFTDEEKLKLNELLENILDEKDEEIKRDISLRNEFKMVSEELAALDEINLKISDYIERTVEVVDKKTELETQLEKDLSKGKYWKSSKIDDRLKDIDEQLRNIQMEKDEEQNIVCGTGSLGIKTVL